jgi:hypothetical protein
MNTECAPRSGGFTLLEQPFRRRQIPEINESLRVQTLDSGCAMAGLNQRLRQMGHQV